MTYTPKPGSKAEKGYQFVRKMGTARSAEIAAAVGVPTSQVMSLLSTAVAQGALICCKVEQPGKDATVEYRIGSGMPPANFSELKRAPKCEQRAPQPAVGQNTGSTPLALLPEAITKGRAVAPAPAKAPPQTAGRSGARNEISLAIDGKGRLTLHLNDGQSDPLVFSEAETLALGDFLVCTELLWRPR